MPASCILTALLSATMLVGLCSPYCIAQSQQTPPTTSPETARGIELYRQENNRAAVEALRAATRSNRNDADAWHYLGLALNREGETREAQQAFEQAVRARPDFAAARTGLAYTLLQSNRLDDAAREIALAITSNAQSVEGHYIAGLIHFRRGNHTDALREAQATLNINNDFTLALLLKSQALISIIEANALASSNSASNAQSREQIRLTRQQQFSEAAESLERYLVLTPNAVDADELRAQLATLQFYARSNDDYTILPVGEVTTQVRITSKPEPLYTEAARNANIRGIVTLRAVFSFDGRVRHIQAVRSLSHGLTEASIEAARRIRFQPATREGLLVSAFVILQYSFNVY